jgi:hypothetical protein
VLSEPNILEFALMLHDRGLAVLPAVAEDGKSVAGVMSGYQKWRKRLPRDKVEQLFKKHSGACIALLVGHCGLVVVDCDDNDALAVAEARFGYTPILVRTPGGIGGHLYYRAPATPVRQANLRQSEGLTIDIKAGKGAYLIAPPSTRPSSGIAYEFERGSWGDLEKLPTFKAVKSDAPFSRHGPGNRNKQLFRRALTLARDCAVQSELAFKLDAVNEAECDPPLLSEEVERIAASAWHYEATGQNRIGRGRYVIVQEARFRQLIDMPDAYALDTGNAIYSPGTANPLRRIPKGLG